MSKQTYYSNGKLLITGEYVVLDGAQALALPTKFGQNLLVEKSTPQHISWKSYDSDGSIWFESEFSFETIIKKKKFEEDTIKTTLIAILHHAHLLNPTFLKNDFGYEISTKLTFPKFWGLGTSSTLINNIAQWLQIDAYTLLKNSFGGSGYDVACAQNNHPIVYQLENEKPRIKEVIFNPIFKDNLFFVYLNQKQSSKTAIANYYNKQTDVAKILPRINQLTDRILHSKDIGEFSKHIETHEIELSNILEMPTVKEALFSDFEGSIKSLGAWGGDFIMVIAKENPETYFKAKGYTIVIPFEEMIL